jgi:hypothetical protein
METKPNTEDQVNRALQSIKKTEVVELPFGFSDRVINKLHAQPTNVRSMYTISPLLKMAAMFILIIANVFTLKLALSTQPVQSPPQYATIKDFVSQYQINDNDANEELLTTNIPTHEQR